jgi:hypothetical protein
VEKPTRNLTIKYNFESHWLAATLRCVSVASYDIKFARNLNVFREKLNQMALEVLTAVVMKSTVLWDITPCSALKSNRRFRGTYGLHLQGRRISQARNQSESRWQGEHFVTLKMEAICSFEISVDSQPTTQHYIPGDSTLHK